MRRPITAEGKQHAHADLGNPLEEPMVLSMVQPLVDKNSAQTDNTRFNKDYSRRFSMSDREVGNVVLDVLEKEAAPIEPYALYARLEGMHIGQFQGRRAVVDLAVAHKVEITADGTVKLLGKRNT